LSAANLLLLCRAGFEKECAQEMTAIACRMGVEGHVRARPDSGFATFHPNDPRRGRDLARDLEFTSLVFPRQIIRVGEVLSDLPVGDRLPRIVAAAKALGTRYCELRIETPDTNDGKALSSLIKPLQPHLERALAAAQVMIANPKGTERLHVFFIGGTACHVGTTTVGNSSPWPMGIPRLRMPRSAPSRSTLKLAEALQEFVGEAALKRRMKPGMKAVDLGAAPGGWSWQLARRDLIVLAVDNGPLDAALMETGQVKQRREDGFRFRPPEPVDWMVCDMVESPSRIAVLAAGWIARGWCTETIFNLKLPMKKRWEEVERCRAIIADALQGRSYRLRIKHLYHDREEVTAWIASSANR
jgi:23S rRNA (cytidine2498-2'-O)-methyltransferase